MKNFVGEILDLAIMNIIKQGIDGQVTSIRILFWSSDNLFKKGYFSKKNSKIRFEVHDYFQYKFLLLN